MKSYHEMANSVLHRIDEYNTEKKRRQKNTVRSVVAVGCACLTVLVGIGVWHRPAIVPDEPGISTTPDSGVSASILQAVYLDGGAVKTGDLTETQPIPMRYKLLVEDKRKLDADPAARAAYDSSYQMLTKQREEWLELYDYRDAGGSVANFENVTISAFYAGHIRLEIGNPAQVESIRAACNTGYGKVEMTLRADSLAGQEVAFDLQTDGEKMSLKKPVYESGLCWLYGQDVTMSGETYAAVSEDAAQGKGDFYLRWKPALGLNEALNENPDTSLSAFSDTMTVTVRYKNGTAEQHTLNIRFSDDGDVRIEYQGVTRS